MIDIYKRIVIPAFIWGAIGGVLILIQLYVKMTLQISAPAILIINIIGIISIMVASVFFYKKRTGQIGFTIARELSFLVYLIIVIILMFFRFTHGYFDRFSSIAILFGIVFIYGLGRILSYIVGMNMYNLKSNK